jgi:pimeloyl-ACP methyl ester carboxylesterase
VLKERIELSAAKEISLQTPQGRMAGLQWSVEKGVPVLCLHGWLDNAASFVPMSGFLPELDLLAVDFPGHGHSDHRHATTNYYFTDYLWDIEAVMDALNWSSCHIVGHSLGAAVASLYASAAPERVRSLVMIDAFGPITASPQTSAERLRKSLLSVRAQPRRRKAYESIEDMTRVRLANSVMNEDSARLICERSAQKTDTHLEWRYDPALHWTSPMLMTEEQVLDCLHHIEVPVFSLTAMPLSPFVTADKLDRRMAAIPHGRN